MSCGLASEQNISFKLILTNACLKDITKIVSYGQPLNKTYPSNLS